MTELHSHYSELARLLRSSEDMYADGIPVAILPSLMERRDNGDVFDEGQDFSGIVAVGGAESSITAAASPHVHPSISKEAFARAVEQVLGNSPVFLENVAAEELVSPQVVVWWRSNKVEQPADMLYIAGLPADEKNDFYDVIEQQTSSAVKIINSVSKKPTIWGSWGYASPIEREPTGRGRGVPTNGLGHLHVIDLKSETSHDTLDNQLPATVKLNHYKPWGSLLHKSFGNAFAGALGSTAGSLADIEVTPFSELVRVEDLNGIVNNGYLINFKEPQPYRKALEMLVETASTLEHFYQDITESHAFYYKYQSHLQVHATARHAIADSAAELGFSNVDAPRFADFVLKIRPTYSQLGTWITEMNRDPETRQEDLVRLRAYQRKYDDIREGANGSTSEESLPRALLLQAAADPNSLGTVGGGWPEHAAASYIIDDYEMINGDIYVNSIRLVFGVDSTHAAPEHSTGRILQRAIGQTSLNAASS